MNFIKNIATFLLFILIGLASCVDDVTQNIPVTTIEEPKEIVQATLIGQITDREGNAVSNVLVSLKNGTTEISAQSDDLGFYSLQDIKVKGASAYLELDHPGYHAAYRRISILKDRVYDVDIVLTEKQSEGQFQSGVGGLVRGAEGFELQFESDGIVNSSGSRYNGEVQVFVNVIDPGSKIDYKRSIGDYQARNEFGERVIALKYGTMQVQLLDPQGNELQLAQGSSCNVRFPIPDRISGDVPNELALAHFNVDRGIWEKEGAGRVENNFFVADVSHFSSWTWCEILSDLSGPIVGAVDLQNQGVSFDARTYVFADFGAIQFYVEPSLEGDFSFLFFPAGKPYTLEVWDRCEKTIYERPFNDIPLGDDFGTLVVDTDDYPSLSLSAQVANCDTSIPTNTYGRLCTQELNLDRCEIIQVIDGELRHTLTKCDQQVTGKLWLLNEDLLLTTDPIYFNMSQEDINLGDIHLCDTFKNNVMVILDGSQYINTHRTFYGAIVGGDVEQYIGAENVSDDRAFNMQTIGQLNDLGMYDTRVASLGMIDGSFTYKAINPGDVTVNVTQHIENSEDPGNAFFVPDLLVGTFSGVVHKIDNETEEDLGVHMIEGAFYYERR